jgi:hypothetical protein
MDIQQAVFAEHDRLRDAGEAPTHDYPFTFAGDKFGKRAPKNVRTIGQSLKKRKQQT